jgi:hypothetical protein
MLCFHVGLAVGRFIGQRQSTEINADHSAREPHAHGAVGVDIRGHGWFPFLPVKF